MSECRIDGCDAPASTLVVGPNGLLEVCADCREELINIWGYRSGRATREDVR